MSKHWRDGFAYRHWTLTDTNKKIFVAGAMLDTRCDNIMFDMNNDFLAGVPIDRIVAHAFEKFRWFLQKNEIVSSCGGHHHFNLVMFANILTAKLEADFYLKLYVHFDGTLTVL